MNELQRRLVTILKNVDAPVTPEQIRVRCQLPQDEGLIACNLRGLKRDGKIIQWAPNCFAHKEYKYRGDEQRAPKIEPPKKDSPLKKVNGSAPPRAMPAKPSKSAIEIDEELALLSDLSELKEATAPHQVEDSALKITVLRHLQDLATPRVSAMLGRVIDEDLMPFSAEAGQD